MGRTCALIPAGRIAQSIHLLRGQKVMLDFDLAHLYGVTTKALNQAVKRNRKRFPEDFMFRLTAEEMSDLKSQFVTSSQQRAGKQATTGNRSQFVTGSLKHREAKSPAFAFTEQGVAMLSSVLKSDRAVKVNIAIMRAFVNFRETLENNRELARKFSDLEKRIGQHDEEIAAIIDAIRRLMAPPEKPRREIGFHVRERAPRYRARTRR
ncbi:MAG: ORF6N domain-containing protein [Chthoniobacterales bacterium]